MKESNLTRNHSTAVQRGWTSPSASSTLGPLPVELTNDSGVNLVEGDPVVVLSDGTIARTTTARDTRPVGVCLDDIDDGEDGMVQFEGPVDLINVTASVTAGHYAETSTTGGQATANATRRSGSFAVFTSGGTTPSGFLFGGAPDAPAAVTYGTPSLTLGTSNAAGSTDESIRRDATILAFDATSPTTQALGDSAAVGSATVAARRDHKHAMPAAAVTSSGLTQATGKLLGRSTASTGAIEEITVGSGLSLSGGALTATGGGGGTGLTVPAPVQRAYQEANSQNPTVTIAAAASGNRLLLFVGLRSRAVTSVSCTNVTWTLVSKHNFSTTMYGEIWVGIVAGGSSGTTITVNTGSSDWNALGVVELTDTLTPTLDQNSETASTALGLVASRVGITVAAGRLFAGLMVNNDSSTSMIGWCSAPHYAIANTGGYNFLLGYAPGGLISMAALSGTSTADHVSILCSIT